MTIAPTGEPAWTDSSEVTFLVAFFATDRAAREGEALLGQLSADGGVRVLDGVLVEGFDAVGIPMLRPLENVPRIAALAAGVWTACITEPQASSPAPFVPPFLRIAIHPPTVVAVAAFCLTPRSAVLTARLADLGAAVTATAITGVEFRQLRRRPGRTASADGADSNLGGEPLLRSIKIR